MPNAFVREMSFDQVIHSSTLFLHRSSIDLSCRDWEVVWDLMNKECRDEVTLVETDALLDILENYLHKHK